MLNKRESEQIRLNGRGLRMVALVLFIGVALASVIALTFSVFQKQKELQVATSDSVIWTLSQLEVEYLKYSAAIQTARTDGNDPAKLRDLRQKFDIFYSRVDTVSNLQGLYKYESGQETRAIFGVIGGKLNESIPLIDGNDALLAAGLPKLHEQDAEIATLVRQASLDNLQNFVAVSNVARETVLNMMQLLGALTVGMMIALAITILILFRLAGTNERRAIEQRHLAARMQTILDSSLDAVLVVDTEGFVHQFNGAAEKVFGYTQAEVIGRNLTDLIIPDDYKRAHEVGMQRMRERGEKRLVGRGRVEIEAQRKSGVIFPVELSIEEVISDEQTFFVSFIRDISDRKQAERELVEARDRALAGERTKSRFLAIMSHEMRTPLNGLLGMLELLRQTRTDQKQSFYIDNMEFSGRVLLDLINNVLDLTKLDTEVDALNNSSFDPERLVQEVLASQLALARKNNNQMHYEWVGDPVSGVLSDRARLRQILLNLVNNAIKFTENGEITVEAEILAPLTIDGRPELELRILDTGCGIPEADLTRVFDDFETVDANYDRTTEGSGLGLGIVRRLVEMMGGKIGVESEVGEGSLFWVRLPIVKTDSNDDSAQFAALASSVKSGSNLLMVEDNEINRRVMREMLEAQGHVVTEAHNGNEAVEKASLVAFDAILMDISMPGMDGVSATKHIRASDGPNMHAPIIAVTAHAMPEELQGFINAGMNAVLNKPVVRSELIKTLDQWIGEDDSFDSDEAELEEPEENVIKSLARDLPAEDLAGLVGRFLTETDQVFVDLAAMPYNEENRAEITSMVHKTAGSAGSFGLSDFHHDLALAQTGLKSDPNFDISASVAQLSQSWQVAREDVVRTLDELQISIDK